MSDDNRFFLMTIATICMAIVLVVAIIIGGLTYYNVTIKAKAMEEGYSQTTVPGVGGVYWVKDNKTLSGEPIDQ